MAVDGVQGPDGLSHEDRTRAAETVFDAIVAGLRQGQTNDDPPVPKYRLATDNETWPPVIGTSVEAAPASEGANALLYTTESGERIVVKADVNPGLYGYLTSLKALNETPGAADWIKAQAEETGARILRGDEAAPPIGEVSSILMLNNNRALVELNDGSRLLISSQLTPEAFRQIDAIFQTFAGVTRSQREGYTLVHGEEFTDAQIGSAIIGWENEVGPGVIRAEIGGRKIVVRQDQDPDLYQRLSSAYDRFQNHGKTIDEARAAAGLPPASELDVTAMQTSETDPKDGKKKLTVGELTWKNLIADWKKGIDDGSIKPEDDRAKLYNALQAKGMIENGTSMVELDIKTGLNTTPVTGGDMNQIIDEAAVDTQISELFASEAVQTDFQKKQTEALDKLPNKDEVKAKLEKTAFGKDYADYIVALSRNNKGAAEEDIGRTYAALAAFDPQKAADFSQSMAILGLTTDLDTLLQNPSSITEENTALATQDVVKTLLSALKNGGVNLPRRTVEAIDKFVNEFLGDKQTAAAFGKALQELGDTLAKNGSLTQADIDKVFNKDIYKSLGEGARSSMLTAVSEMNGNGLLGSVGGLISLASGIYQLVGKGGTLADTPEERLAIAKEFVSVLGAGQHFLNFGSTIVDTYNGGKTSYVDMWGLGKSLPEIFGKDEKKPNGPLTAENFEKIGDSFQKIVDEAPTTGRDKVQQQLNLQGNDWTNFLKGYEDGFAKNPGLNGSSPGTRALTSFLRIMDAGANVFAGVADIVLGGLKIKSAGTTGDKAGIAQGAITVAAGAFTFAGGGAQLGALLGLNVARAVAAPLLWVGALLQVALLPFLIIEDLKRTEQIEGFEADQKKFFADIDAQGLLHEDGAKRYEFLGEYMRNYGQRDAPDDQSIFEYRSEEYEFWLAEGHLPEPGFDDLEHEDYKGDGENLTTQMEDT